MRILGVDPGLRVTGYGVLSARPRRSGMPGLEVLEAGVVRTDVRSGIAARLNKIHASLTELVRELRPEVIVLEKLYAHYAHPATAILMAHARGAVCLVAGASGIPLESVAATHVKKAVTGHGHAAKGQIQRMVQHVLELKSPPDPPDVADALAIAIAYASTLKERRK